MRVGIGYDVHPLVEGRDLVLGGMKVDHEFGLSGHSDGDVLCHAIIDALLGAAGVGDIGRHFPADDEQFAGAKSLELLEQTVHLLSVAGLSVGNVDATIMAEAPKVAPHVDAMRTALASALGIDPSQVNVKATTTDRLGAIGRGEGIAAVAVALIDSM